MKSILMTSDLQDGLVPSDTSISELGWSRSECQVPLTENATVAQKQNFSPDANTGAKMSSARVAGDDAYHRLLELWNEIQPELNHTAVPRLAFGSTVEAISKTIFSKNTAASYLLVGPIEFEVIIKREHVAVWQKILEHASKLHPATESHKAVALEPTLEESIYDRLHGLFLDASDEIFEDGMNTNFSTNLHRIIQNNGVAAINVLERLVWNDDANVEVVEEALRQIGHMDHRSTHRSRLSLLKRALESRNPRVRDAACIGIEAMEDPDAIKCLQSAIKKEQSEQLRQNLIDVLEQLQDSR